MGDSLGMVVLGHDSIVSVILDAVIHHARAVVRGTSKALVVVNLPFMTYTISLQRALRSTARIMQEAGVQAVKLEGGRHIAPTVQRLTESGILAMGRLS